VSEPPRIAILGAPGTGKSTLAEALRHAVSPTVLQVAPSDDDEARQHRQLFNLTLLTGLDLLPATADQARLAALDQTFRDALSRYGLPYSLVYGQGKARSDNALLAIRFHLRDTEGLQQPASRWHWACDKCSDPDCEHQLFSNLLRNR
jgi:GTPase SAR1 family protein